MFINSKESKALAETVNIPKFFTEVIPLSEKRMNLYLLIKKMVTCEVRDDYMNLILGHYEVEQSLKKKESLRGSQIPKHEERNTRLRILSWWC